MSRLLTMCGETGNQAGIDVKKIQWRYGWGGISMDRAGFNILTGIDRLPLTKYGLNLMVRSLHTSKITN